MRFLASGGLFSPSFPLVPVEPELARLWDYPVGYNLQFTPRTYEPVSFSELRALANTETLTRMAIIVGRKPGFPSKTGRNPGFLASPIVRRDWLISSDDRDENVD